jgi:uncharacterized protein YfaS (alpha-2-macroglobulin family)
MPESSGSDEGAQLFNFILPRAHAQTAPQVSTHVTPMETNFVDKREDRLVVYGTVRPDLQEINYKLKAVVPGTYVVPAAFGEGMYDRLTRYRGVHGQVRIIK